MDGIAMTVMEHKRVWLQLDKSPISDITNTHISPALTHIDTLLVQYEADLAASTRISQSTSDHPRCWRTWPSTRYVFRLTPHRAPSLTTSLNQVAFGHLPATAFDFGILVSSNERTPLHTSKRMCSHTARRPDVLQGPLRHSKI